MKRVIVTGAAGFIAPHIIERCLQMNWQVIGLDVLDLKKEGLINHSNYTFYKKDVKDLIVDDLRSIDYIFHLAFVTNIPHSIKNPLSTTYDNVNMTCFLLKLATQAGIKKFLFPSTASLYGNNPVPWQENMPADPAEPYSWQKLCCEHACKMWHKCYNLPTIIFRFFQVFGENQRKDTALAAFLRSKEDGQPITLTETTAQSSFRTAQRDFIYVKDLAEAVVRAAESKKTGHGEIINIGSGKITAMEDIAKAIGGKIVFIPKRSFETETHQADISLAKKLLNWTPKTDVLSWLKNYVKKNK